MLDHLDGNLAHYRVSHENAFLPDRLPLQRLPDPYYAEWESVIEILPQLLRSGELISAINDLPILETSRLSSEEEWRRAYVILGFFTHAYIWGGEKPSEVLPPCITLPFLEVSEHLGLPPTATYAAVNLWNYKTVDPTVPLSVPENLRVLHSFTGTDDEAWFYLISVAIESRGAHTVPLMMQCIDAAARGDHWKVVQGLDSLRVCINELGVILERMYERLDPQVFYFHIRPFLAGSKGMATAGLPRGVFYDEGDGKGEWRQYSGGSNAQSSLIQFFDIVLGVRHTSGGELIKNSFIEEMRFYMPGPHRRFLQYLDRAANIREYALNPSTENTVLEAYDAAVAALAAFRDKHIQIVTRYIIMPSRMKAQKTNTVNIASASSIQDGEDKADKKLYGTGGTALIPFLKQTRDETKKAASSQ
ncbi:putative indoleamine -dioxygenase pyrrole protein [Lasiodiplodia theobromae]|uniref:Indoleamine 2,3-dioxygenase n=1 Tax=Lasiodiplodia theobromae TaxID=45133 RepID=A0A5N5DNF6_9PEZI|nr:Indoleaminedioxygenase pyrroledioxygenase [Lasiodiplodia theobromae]KAB2579476.1 Indoleamine 2,3-dioxygenase [Lasiodiplodia theobromae]KAF4542117.1 Indoleaminedioxygenase pyrroledioxygenase [Lasiodiplodia theobromae]KAF9635449.1 putative indoleamine -dioxygenase pyrrole protein [Lasiodiplodia theobromae]